MIDFCKDRYFIVKPVNGLANRLRVLFSYKIIADYLNIPFYVYWDKSHGFDDTQLCDLISVPNFNFVDKTIWEDARSVSFKIDRRISGTSEYKVDDSLNKNAQTSTLLNNSFNKITAEVSNLPNWSFGVNLQSKIPTHMELYKTHLKTLRVSDRVKKSAEKLIEKFTNETIGVHIRCGDSLDKQNNKFNLFTKHTDNKYFLDFLEKYKGTIFLSTDDAEVSNYFISKLKNKIIFYSKHFQKSVYGAEKLGQFDAMVEMYLLSCTTYMIPTSPSSFSKFASDWGGGLYQKCNFNYITDPQILDVVNW
jgi:hypothetical protein